MMIVAALAGSTVLSACVTQEEYRGYAIEFAKLDQIKPGSSKDEVLAALGSPSTTSTFGSEQWYYINMKMEQGALVRPKMVAEDTIIVTFNEGGTVKTIERSAGEERRDIAVAKDKTRTEGNSVTVMQQFLGNLGRFNSGDKSPNKVHTPQPGL